jgi:membrane protease YdiL (CAAX protease family)
MISARSEALTEAAEPDILGVSVAVVLSASFGCALVRWISSYREPDPWAFLGLRGVPPSTMIATLGSAALVYLLAELIIPTDFGTAEASFAEGVAMSPAGLLFLIALVGAAPVFEEFLFRGFLYGGMTSTGTSATSASIVSLIAWCVLHTRESVDGYAAVLILGLLLTGTRQLTNSVIPCLLVHCLWNLAVLLHPLIVA